MRIVMMGANHRTAPVELRERMAIAAEDDGYLLFDLRK